MAKKVAIIDDEEMIVNLYSKVLSKEFKVVTAFDGTEGLELIENEKPDVILVDIRMPKMDGLAMIEEMKKKDLLYIPVLVLTNLIEDEKVAKAIEIGAKGYFLKSRTTPADIKEEIKKLL